MDNNNNNEDSSSSNWSYEPEPYDENKKYENSMVENRKNEIIDQLLKEKEEYTDYHLSIDTIKNKKLFSNSDIERIFGKERNEVTQEDIQKAINALFSNNDDLSSSNWSYEPESNLNYDLDIKVIKNKKLFSNSDIERIFGKGRNEVTQKDINVLFSKNSSIGSYKSKYREKFVNKRTNNNKKGIKNCYIG